MIMYVYVVSSFAELLVCVFVFRARFGIPVIQRFDSRKYFGFLREALPQFGITVCNTALQRMDWILLGVLSTSVALAEYSFTNKLFELLLLPLLMIAPVLFPMVIKAVTNVHQHTNDRLNAIIRIEVMVAVLVALIVNACWKDVIDLVTAEKYGSSTSTLILIMSFAMPLAYINNFFWSIHFAKGNMRIIFVCILVTFFVNILFDCLLIPYFGAAGAAIGFVLANVVQVFYYSVKNDVLNIPNFFFHTLLAYVNGMTAGLLAGYFFTGSIPKTLFSVAVYFILLVATRQLRINDWTSIKQITVV
jgi:O-antigen/teichoic acid export membrane protein